jgi:hypothetical protein
LELGVGRRKSIIEPYKRGDHVHRIGLVGWDRPVHKEYNPSVHAVVSRKKKE